MRPPFIGITTERNDHGEYSQQGAYIEAVRRAGGIPLLIPAGEPYLEQLLAMLDGLILSGGGDVDPAHYGSPGHATIYEVDPQRDATELALARMVTASGMPTLCICRGAQIVNVALGGTLIEHLPDAVGESVEHRQSPPGYIGHPVAIAPGSKLANIVGEPTVEAASWHHQAIRTAAPGLSVTAQAADGTIEAVEMTAHPWLIAVQWHPEITAGQDPVQQHLFDEFVAAARRSGGVRSPESY
jgi:putative glutamine amidotransferase